VCGIAGRKHGWSYRFRVSNVGAGVELTSAFLWLHKNRDVSSGNGSRLTLNVNSVCGDDSNADDSSRRRSQHYQLSWSSGWVQLDVTELLARQSCRLTVRCVGSLPTRCRQAMSASSARRRPFVVVGTAAARDSGRRSRRHLRRCVDGDCCALYPYNVNFRDLGWRFIVQPRVLAVNFCYGSCRS